MKKFASVLLAVLVAFSMFSFVVSAAAPSLTVSADKSAVKVGESVNVTVKLAEKSGLGALTYDITYDAEAFEATGIVCDYAGAVVNEKYAAGKARVTLAAATTVDTAVTVTLTLKAVKADDKADFAIAVVEACDADFNTVTVNAGSTSVKVEAVEAPTEPTEPDTTKPTEPDTTEPTEPTECTHETMSSWAQTKAPTCKEAGVKTRNCTTCGYEETEAVPATGKCSYKWVVTKEATEEEEGEKQFKCTMCGHVKETQKLQVIKDTLEEPAIPNTDAIA